MPAALALAFAYVERPTRGLLASTAAAGLVLAVIHPTYAIFLWLPFAGFLVVRSLVARDESRRIATALAALVVPAAAFLVWLLPVVRDTASHAPGKGELQRAFQQYAGQLDVFSDTSYRLAPEVFGRAGAVAIAALVFVPLAGLALRRRWAAVRPRRLPRRGGGDARAAAVRPVLRSRLDLAVAPRRRLLAAGVRVRGRPDGARGAPALRSSSRSRCWPGSCSSSRYPGEFDYRLEHGGPALVTWFAVVGGRGRRSCC